MTFADLPIRRKLMILLVLISGVVLLVTSIIFGLYEWFFFRQYMVTNISTLAEIIADNSTAALAFRDEAAAGQILSALKAEEQILAASLYDMDGNLFAKYPPSAPDGRFPKNPRVPGHQYESGKLTLTRVVEEGENVYGMLYIQADTRAVIQRLKLYAGIAGIVMIFSGLTAFALTNTLQKRISQPILSLAGTAQRISKDKDYSLRAVRTSNDELGTLTDAFNDMLIQIQERDTALLETATELAHSNAELQQFAYVASHDLQEPLRAIAGCVQILEKRYNEQIDEKGKELISHAVDGSVRMQNLINDLLAYSRIGTKAEPFEPQDCNEIVRAALANLRVAIEEKKAKVNLEYLPTLDVDRTQMTQLFQNLLSNALKFTADRSPEIRIGSIRNAKDWIFSVHDNGIGIDPQYFERIFMVFQRLHTRREYPGTGIGLAICKKIVERRGGKIWIESRPGTGSTFYFSVPDLE